MSQAVAGSSSSMLPFFDVEKGFNEPENEAGMSDAEKKKLDVARCLDASALSKIHMSIGKSIFLNISSASTTKEEWDTLEQELHGDKKVRTMNLQTLQRDFHNLKMKDSENILEYQIRVMEIVNQMRMSNEKVSDQLVVEKILINLTGKYKYMVAAIEESKDLMTLTIRELIGSLQAHKKRIFSEADQSNETAFQTQF
ncbi:hypothetical protein Salat_1555100 [Sesamum alatum]|uniref:UBN2 domain-containing protein n=1 Tax=Sesamum alatum TaxID=300844 RepID=A0AAE1YDK8_9LAMI|nr:hypothetical protein Salat_1555100 [Sesamum alatum]